MLQVVICDDEQIALKKVKRELIRLSLIHI